MRPRFLQHDGAAMIAVSASSAASKIGAGQRIDCNLRSLREVNQPTYTSLKNLRGHSRRNSATEPTRGDR
jgi:hypothetical protein